jgi:hypothetical protein
VITPEQCLHPTSEPVDVRDHTTGGTLAVARICVDCLAQLEPGWGCEDCEWTSYETRAMCEPMPTIVHVLVRPCKEHA